MRPVSALPLLLSLSAFLVAGCQTDSVFQSRRNPPQQTRPTYAPYDDPSYGGTYDGDGSVSPWEARRTQPANTSRRTTAPDPRATAAREATRISELEATVARLQSQLDSMSAAQADVVAQAGATVSRSGAAVDALRPDIATLRAEIDALKAENRSLREEMARQKSQMDALPDEIVTKVNAILPKAQPTPRQQPTTQRRASEGWEHVVASGDTLSAIAQTYGVSQSDIIRENGLKDANSLRVGQKLFIPRN